MTGAPLISVVVPVYNVAKYLPRCLDSIASQTYANLDIILVDDGSTDNSGKIADEYAKTDKRAQVIHQKNGGLSEARNAGLRYAKGDYVAFVDSDDYMSPSYIEKLYDIASKNGADVATCQFQSFSEESLKLKKSPDWTRDVMTGRESAIGLLIGSHPAYIWTSLFKRSLFTDNAIEFPVGRTYEDVATRFKLQYFAGKVVFTNERLYHYLVRRSSITGIKFSETRFNDLLFAVESIKDFSAQKKVTCPEIVNYFDFKISMLILNSLAKENALDKSLSKYWVVIVKRLKKLHKQVKFPSTQSRIVYTGLYVVAHSRVLYSLLYKIKGVIK